MKILTASLATVIFLPLMKQQHYYATAFIAPSQKQSAFFRRPLGTSTSSQVHEAPTPLYEIDFSDPEDTSSNLPEPFTLHGGAEIKPGPGGSNALRINRSLAYAELPGVDISPKKMTDCTLVISVYLESIVTDSNGWILTSDNGNFDRSIILHDDRFKGLGLGVGHKDDVCFYDDEKVPEVGKWIQFSAVFRQGGACNLYYNDEKAPKSNVGKNEDDALNCLRIGTEKIATEEWKDHFCDAWVGDVKVFDRALDDDEIEELNKEFQDKVNGVDDSEDSEGGSGSDSGSNQNSLPPVYAEGMLQDGMLIALESVLYPGAFWEYYNSNGGIYASRLKVLDPYVDSGHPGDLNQLKVWKYYDREQDPIEEFVGLQAIWETYSVDAAGYDTFVQCTKERYASCSKYGVDHKTLKTEDGDELYQVPWHTWQFHTVHDDIVEIVLSEYCKSPPIEERAYMYVEPNSKGEGAYDLAGGKDLGLEVFCGVPTHEDEEIATKGKQWRVHIVQPLPSLPDGTIVALESLEFPGMYIDAGEELSKRRGHCSWCSLSDKHYNEGDNLRKWRVVNTTTNKNEVNAIMFECVDRPGVFLGDGRVEHEYRTSMESYKETSLGWKVNTHDLYEQVRGGPGFLPHWRDDNVFELQSSKLLGTNSMNWNVDYENWLSVDEDGDLLCRKDSTNVGSGEKGAPVLGEGNWNKWKYHIVEE